MKIFSSLMVMAVMSVAGVAQQSEGRIVASIGSSESVKNSPFSAEAISESVQTLADGNRIVRNSTSKIYRNSEGRIRREMAKGTGAGFGTFSSFEPGVTIMSPLGSKYLLDTQAKIATEMSLLPMRELNIVGAGQLTAEQKEKIEKLRSELKLRDGQPLTPEQKATMDKLQVELRSLAPATAVAGVSSARALTAVGAAPFAFGFGGSDAKYDTKTEDLGTRDFEGVSAEGTRRVTTIPAGAIGNERPIETVYERWYSKDLQMVVMSKHSDPRFGEQTYRLTNIVRAEPDPSLFNVPTGYKVVSGTGVGNDYYYRVTAPDRAPRPAKATVVSTKP